MPTAETVKQTFFLNLALSKGLPLGMIGRQEIVQGEVRDERHQLLGKDQRQLHAGGDHVQA